MEINYTKLNPVAFHLLKLLQDKNFRQIILYGGSSSGKSYSVAQCFLLMLMAEGVNMLVMRKVGATIKDSIYQSFKAAADQLEISDYFQFKDGIKVIRCNLNGAEIIFKGLDDSEKIKGLERIKRVFMDEWNEFEEKDYKQMKLRLRGMEGQQLVFAFNPVKETHWIKKKVFDVEKWHNVPMTVEIAGAMIPPELTEVKSIRMNEPKTLIHKRTGEIIEHPSDMVVIQSTYLNNFWVIGSPDGTYGYYDEQCIATFEYDREHDPDYFNVYALGEWGIIRTGSEFFGSFKRGQHTADVSYDPSLPVHICVDSNVLPYITITYWQVAIDGERYHLRQIGETCAESPDNTVRKSAKLVAKKLKGMGVDTVILHGDASTRASNNIDDEKRSFHDLFIDTLEKEGITVIDKVGHKNPSIQMSGEFINAIFDSILPDIQITISESCPVSIEDYMSVQKDANGAIAKTKVKNKITMQTYEEHGHISDTFRYVVMDILTEQFIHYTNRRKRSLFREGAINYANPDKDYTFSRDIVYAMPNICGKFGMVHGKLCGDKWHIVDLVLKETSSTDEIADIVAGANSPQTIIECPPAYFRFVRDLRKRIPNVRAMNEVTDVARRISATSDFVRNHLLFDINRIREDEVYSQFISMMLDFDSKRGENIEASAVISGFIQFVIKLGFER